MRRFQLSQLIGTVLITASCSAIAFAEQPVQAGETLESLSKAKVTTTVNGQAGSLADLISSGKIQLISTPSNSSQSQPLSPQKFQADLPNDKISTPSLSVPSIDPNAPAQTVPESAPSEPPAQ